MGPLGIASLDGPHPLQPRLVESYQDEHTFRGVVQKFKEDRLVAKGQHFYTPPLDGFESGVKPQVRTCSGGGANCSKEIFDEKGGPRLKGTAAALLDYLRLVLVHIEIMRKTEKKKRGY